MINSQTKRELNIFLGLGLFSTLLLFFVSSDSYTHDLYNKVDSAWFYMCGKAWMEGLTPYVDFADSKGPLLWLIYGIGYLLNPYNYLGVFWISCLWYSFTLYFTYKTAQIFLQDTRKSVICAMLMACCYLHTWYHNEVRAEDFALLFMVISLYATCRMFYGVELTAKTKNGLMFALGASCSLLFLIKFNLAAMQFGFILAAIYLIIHNQWGIKPLLWVVAGGLGALLPFAIYFIAEGNLVPFLQEYILNTFQTVSGNSSFIPKYISTVLYRTIDKTNAHEVTLTAFAFLGAILYAKKLKNYKYLPLLGLCYIFAINFVHIQYYSYALCSFCLIFLVVWLIDEFVAFSKNIATILIVGAAFGFCVIGNCLSANYNQLFRPMFWRGHRVEQRAFYDMNYIIEQVKQPTILNAACYEYGVGILSQTLPACKYWALQNGATQPMKDDQKQCILSQKADFIYVHYPEWLEKIDITVDDILNAGYVECYQWSDASEQAHILFSKHQLKLPPETLNVTMKDVLTKRTDFDWVTK